MDNSQHFWLVKLRIEKERERKREESEKVIEWEREIGIVSVCRIIMGHQPRAIHWLSLTKFRTSSRFEYLFLYFSVSLTSLLHSLSLYPNPCLWRVSIKTLKASWKRIKLFAVFAYSTFLSVSLSHCCVVVVLAPTKRKKITSWKRMKILSQY